MVAENGCRKGFYRREKAFYPYLSAIIFKRPSRATTRGLSFYYNPYIKQVVITHLVSSLFKVSQYPKNRVFDAIGCRLVAGKLQPRLRLCV